eukprot:scaffold101908_cov59-Phaeocystis_antarctica.AAC.2
MATATAEVIISRPTSGSGPAAGQQSRDHAGSALSKLSGPIRGGAAAASLVERLAQHPGADGIVGAALARRPAERRSRAAGEQRVGLGLPRLPALSNHEADLLPIVLDHPLDRVGPAGGHALVRRQVALPLQPQLLAPQRRPLAPPQTR